MIYTVLLAAGSAKKFNDNLPKQFHLLHEKPVFIYTLEKFLNYDTTMKVVIVIAKEYIEYAKELLKRYIKKKEMERISIIIGGECRTKSLMNGCAFLKDNFNIKEDDIVITHDVNRPFVNNRIIDEHIEKLNVADGVTTAFPAYSSILEIEGNNVINLPNRSNLKILQTPQSFRLMEFIRTFESLSEEEINTLVEASKIYILRNKKVVWVEGEQYNLKISTKYDLKIANYILSNNLKIND